MNLRTRALVLALVGSMLATTATELAHAAVPEKKQKAQNPCKLVAKSEIEAQFGGPLTKFDSDPNSKDDCGYEVAANDLSPQGGSLVVRLLWPSKDSGTAAGDDAIDAVEKAKEFDAQGHPIVDLTGVGESAYLNDFTVTITFAKNTKRAYSIQWSDNDISGFGLPTPPPIIDRLVVLANHVID